jgi:predicted ATPase/DNA-binding winged helix-turn-helix (wHTH) protein
MWGIAPRIAVMPTSRVYRFGAFELDAAAGQLRRDGRALPLRPRPFALLQVLVERAGRILSKDELLDAAWPGVVVEENNLQVQVSVLRKLIGVAAIETVPARGYRFALDVQHGDAIAAPTMAMAGPDRLVGRDADLAALIAHVQQHRLVTITGPGGIGKTRLARAVLAAVQPLLSDAGAWIDLSAVSDPALLVACVLDALGVAGAPDADRLVTHLRERQMLLVMDNAEHLLEPVAQLAAVLLARTPALRLLVTSQAPLRLPGEQQVRLEPLGLPASGASPDEARQAGAVALFFERAHACDGRLVLDAQSLPAVVEICRRLDGIPLALELAATRVPAFGLRGVASLLGERFRLLNAGHRTAPVRQQTLLAVYDWTYGLLSGDEQSVFRRLGAMAAPSTLQELAEIIAQSEGPGDAWQVFDRVASLVERSLVQMDDGDPPRYSLLESARAYALSKLAELREHEYLVQASGWYERAGDRAAQAASGTAALAAYGSALELARMLPEGAQRDERELDLSLKLGPAIQATIGPTHPRCEEVYRRSVELAHSGPAGERAFKAIWGYWQFLSLAGRDSEAAPFAHEIVEMAAALPDDGLQLEALHAAMTTSDLLGDAPAVVANARRITGMYDRCRHHKLTFAFGGHDPGVCALGQGALNLWLTGESAQARDMAAAALELAASLEHGYSRATGAYYAAITYAALGDTSALKATANALVDLSGQYGMDMLLTEGHFLQGRARFERGDADGIDVMQSSLAVIEASHDLAFVFVYMSLLADALLARGDLPGVEALAQRAVTHAKHGQRLFLPEVIRLRAKARALTGDGRWKEDLQEALTMAASQGAVALQVRVQETSAGLAP